MSTHLHRRRQVTVKHRMAKKASPMQRVHSRSTAKLTWSGSLPVGTCGMGHALYNSVRLMLFFRHTQRTQ